MALQCKDGHTPQRIKEGSLWEAADGAQQLWRCLRQEQRLTELPGEVCGFGEKRKDGYSRNHIT